MSLSTWEDVYRNHPAWSQVDQIKSLLAHGPDTASETEDDHLDRLQWLVTHLEDLRINPVLLVSNNSLDQLNAALAQVIASLTNWANNSGSNYLLSAGGVYADGVLDALRAWPATKDRVQRGLLRAGLDFKADSEASLTRLRDELAALHTDAERFSERSSEIQTEGDAHLAALQAEISASTEDIAQQKQRLDKAINGIQDTFLKAETERATAHARALEKQATTARNAADRAKKLGNEALAELVAAGNEKITTLDGLKAQADNLVSAIGLTGTATVYGAYAEQEKKTANQMRYLALAAFAASFILFLVTLLASHVTDHSSWQVVVFKLAGSIALLAGGGYASHESAEHRREERHAKSVQLDLAALDPFIVNLNDEQRQDIKAAAARRLFTGPEAAPTTSTSSDDDVQLSSDIATALLSVIREAAHAK